MNPKIDSWAVTRPHGVLTQRRGGLSGNAEFIGGAVWTSGGIVSVDAGRYDDGDRYLSMRYIREGRCYSLYTQDVPTFTKLAMTRRAAAFAAEVETR